MPPGQTPTDPRIAPLLVLQTGTVKMNGLVPRATPVGVLALVKRHVPQPLPVLSNGRPVNDVRLLPVAARPLIIAVAPRSVLVPPVIVVSVAPVVLVGSLPPLLAVAPHVLVHLSAMLHVANLMLLSVLVPPPANYVPTLLRDPSPLTPLEGKDPLNMHPRNAMAVALADALVVRVAPMLMVFRNVNGNVSNNAVNVPSNPPRPPTPNVFSHNPPLSCPSK